MAFLLTAVIIIGSAAVPAPSGPGYANPSPIAGTASGQQTPSCALSANCAGGGALAGGGAIVISADRGAQDAARPTSSQGPVAPVDTTDLPRGIPVEMFHPPQGFLIQSHR
jgi:hypothetical protein